MPALPSVPARSHRDIWPLVLPAVVAFAYACGHLRWYGNTPLGQVPVLDEQENLAFAEAIVRGVLPHEPFYRAPGYALLLATLRAVGVPTTGLFSVALFIGAVLHAVNATLIARIARSLFGGGTVALIAGLLYALHPVFVHYATQALDAVPALTLFLLGLCRLTSALMPPATEPGYSSPDTHIANPGGGELARAPLAQLPGPARSPEPLDRLRASSRPRQLVERASLQPAATKQNREGAAIDAVNAIASWRWAGASVSWAAAAMFRPNYLMVWCVLPVLAAWALRAGGSRTMLAAAFAGTVVFASVAGWQWRVSGVAGFLPWQGPYNLWAANQPGAHGRFYVQRHSLPASLARQNPARAESIYLYQQETGAAPPDIRALNAHWHSRFIHHVVEQPFMWLGQLGRKAYALLNNWEQYNNKTFAFHQARSPWLRWNPLGWGILFVLGVAGGARLASEAPVTAVKFALIVAACAASVLLFFVSARFRLPLGALATIFAAGALAAPRFWIAWPRGRQMALIIAGTVAAATTFSTFDHVRDRATFVQDHALLARAADTVGDDTLAWREATAALALQPMHRDALRLAVASYFNHLVLVGPIAGAETQWREICGQFLSLPDNDARDLQAVAALALWRGRQPEAALAAWRDLGATPSALAARLLVNDVRLAQIDSAAWTRTAWDEPLVRLAALQFNLAPPAGVALGDAHRAAAVAQRLFATESAPKQP